MKNITRRAVVAAVVLAAAAGAWAQDDAAAHRFSDNARAVLAKLEAGTQQVSQTKDGGFVRIEMRLSGAPSMDVKRTDSVLEPVRATVDVPLRMLGAGPVGTEEAAATVPAKPMDEFRLQAVYVPDGGAWRMKSARTWSKQLGGWMPGAFGVESIAPMFEVAAPAPAPAAAPQPSTRSRKAMGL